MQRISRAERRRSSRELAKRPQWETLEEFTRSRIQTWIQDLLEEEVTELLGRRKSERRDPVDASAGYRNGHGKPRRLSTMAGTIESRGRVVLPAGIDRCSLTARCGDAQRVAAAPGAFGGL